MTIRSKLVSTKEDMSKIKTLLNTAQVIEFCARERENTTWNFYKQRNVTFFAGLLMEVPKGYKIAVVLEPLFKNCSMKCLDFEESTRKPYNSILCHIRALALHLRGNNKL